jgi:hypothetical protein
VTKWDETEECWRKLHKKEFHNLYCSPHVIIMIKSKKGQLGRACSTRKPEGKGSLGRPRRNNTVTCISDYRRGSDW